MNDKLVVMNPSITIADGEVLSVEEKFQGGTGVGFSASTYWCWRRGWRVLW